MNYRPEYIFSVFNNFVNNHFEKYTSSGLYKTSQYFFVHLLIFIQRAVTGENSGFEAILSKQTPTSVRTLFFSSSSTRYARRIIYRLFGRQITLSHWSSSSNGKFCGAFGRTRKNDLKMTTEHTFWSEVKKDWAKRSWRTFWCVLSSASAASGRT